MSKVQRIETNFVIGKFRELLVIKQHEIWRHLISKDGKVQLQAAVQLLRLLTSNVNELAFKLGEPDYIVFPQDFEAKAAKLLAYFQLHLKPSKKRVGKFNIRPVR